MSVLASLAHPIVLARLADHRALRGQPVLTWHPGDRAALAEARPAAEVVHHLAGVIPS